MGVGPFRDTARAWKLEPGRLHARVLYGVRLREEEDAAIIIIIVSGLKIEIPVH